jgi:hypothetical protein
MKPYRFIVAFIILLLLAAVLYAAPTAQVSLENPTLLHYGDVVTGTIGDGEYDVYAFEGHAGDHVIIDAAKSSGESDIQLDFYYPSGHLFMSDDTRNEDGSVHPVHAPTSVLYDGLSRIVITHCQSCSGKDEVSYTLSLTADVLAPPAESAGATPLPTIAAEPVGGRGSITTAASVLSCPATDCPVLGNVAAGDHVLVLGVQNGFYAVQVNTVDRYGFVPMDMVRFDAPPTAPPPPTAPIPSELLLPYDQPITGTLSGKGAASYIFVGTAGDVISVVAGETSGTSDVTLEILGPNNQVVASDTRSNIVGAGTPRILNMELRETGQYRVNIAYCGLCDQSEPAEYFVYIRDLSTSFPSSMMENSVLEYSGSVTDSLFPDEANHYTFTGAANDVISLRATTVFGQTDLYLILFGPDGQLVAADDDSNRLVYGDPLISFVQLPATGDYLVVVTACPICTSEDLTTYELDLRLETQIMTATPVPPDTGTAAPAPTNALSPDQDPTILAMSQPIGDGSYRVGVDIMPGRWESQGSSRVCNWQRLSRYGEILDWHNGLAGGTIYVQPRDYEIRVEGCGLLVYIENQPTPPLQADAAQPKDGNGIYRIGVEIQDGLWRMDASSVDCRWTIYDMFHERIENRSGYLGATVVLWPDAYEVEFSHCGLVQYVGPIIEPTPYPSPIPTQPGSMA